jgi:hypothetical protein
MPSSKVNRPSPGSSAPASPVTSSPETELQILGSLRKNDPGDPAAGKTPPTPVLENGSFGESGFGISRPAAFRILKAIAHFDPPRAPNCQRRNSRIPGEKIEMLVLLRTLDND